MAQLKIDLSFSANDIDVDYVARKIGTLPTRAINSSESGSVITSGLQHIENKWSISIDAAETDDAEYLIDELLTLMIPKKELLAEMSAVLGGTWTVSIVGLVRKGAMPAVYLDRRFFEFCKYIQAAVIYDIRVSPDYTDDE